MMDNYFEFFLTLLQGDIRDTGEGKKGKKDKKIDGRKRMKMIEVKKKIKKKD